MALGWAMYQPQTDAGGSHGETFRQLDADLSRTPSSSNSLSFSV